MVDFVHLRSHSEYSIEDGMLKTNDLARLAASDKQGAIALTDSNSMFGMVNFYSDARNNGVKPIIGVDVWVEPDVTLEKEDKKIVLPTRLLLLAKNQNGYRTIMKLLGKAYLKNQKHGLPAAVKQSWLKEEDCKDVIALSGDFRTGEIGQCLMSGLSTEKALEFYKEVFGDQFFLEIQRAGFPGEDEWVQKTVELSEKSGIPLVATHPIQFEKREDYFAHEVGVCIHSGEVVDDISRKSHFTREQSFKTRDEMSIMFQDLPEALENAAAIGKMCSSEIEIGVNHLPEYPTERGEPVHLFFENESKKGLEERLVKLFPNETERNEKRPEYLSRLEHEIRVIQKMGFEGYFLVVSDFIRWAKKNGIPVGPGRGSGAGSLVAYALKITDLDPIKYGLLFERFLNPDRVSLPDFDVDFESSRRKDVIKYVREKYGNENVAQIATIGGLKAKAIVRGVGRALQLPYKFIDTIAKLIPEKVDMTLSMALQMEPKLKEKYDNDRVIKKLLDVALRLEGKPNSIGMHAGGVIIAPQKIENYAPLYMAEPASSKNKNADESMDDEGGVVTQYDKEQAEKVGLIKFDFLGLSTLSLLDKTIALINKRPEFSNEKFVLEDISLTDKTVYDELSKGNSYGVFQFESAGMQNMLKKSKPHCLEDLIALVALYRPGSMSFVDEYCLRREGAAFEYPDPRLESLLKETLGIMIYQEQVMQTAQIIGGYTLGEADLLRRAMGKKKPEEMARHRAIFEEGASKKGVSKEKATEIYDTMEAFAGYGFNKSHAAAYGLVSYQSAYLKFKYPAEYYAASLTVNASKTEDLDALIKDAKANGISVIAPDINLGVSDFTPIDEKTIAYGLTGIKGVGSNTPSTIADIRKEHGEFTSFFDFCKKIAGRGVNKTAISSLIRAGAFDKLHNSRADLLASVEDGIAYAGKLVKKAQETGPLLPELQDELSAEKVAKKKRKKKVTEVLEPMLTTAEPWSELEKLDNEFMALGFYFSSHPFDGYKERFDGLKAALPLQEVDSITSTSSNYLVAGLVSKLKQHVPANGKKMAFISINDGKVEKEITIFNSVYEDVQDWLKVGAFAGFEVKIEPSRRGEEYGNSMIAEQVFSSESLGEFLVDGLHVNIAKDKVGDLFEIVKENAGAGKVIVYMKDGEDDYLSTELNEKYKIATNDKVIRKIKEVFGDNSVVPIFKERVLFEPRRRPMKKYGKK